MVRPSARKLGSVSRRCTQRAAPHLHAAAAASANAPAWCQRASGRPIVSLPTSSGPSRAVLGIGLRAERVQHLAEEAARGGRSRDVEDVEVAQALCAQAIDVGLGGGGGIAHHLLREFHDRDVARPGRRCGNRRRWRRAAAASRTCSSAPPREPACSTSCAGPAPRRWSRTRSGAGPSGPGWRRGRPARTRALAGRGRRACPCWARSRASGAPARKRRAPRAMRGLGGSLPGRASVTCARRTAIRAR